MSPQTIIIPSPSIIITRPMELADVEALVAIELQCFPEEAWPASIFPSLASNAFTTQVATEPNGEIIGFIVASKPVDGWVYIHDLAVATSARRVGVARQLMSELLDKSRADNVSLHLHVKEGNEGAIALYRDLGFKTRVTVENFYRVGNTTALHMSWSAS
jgi:ribosomal-protein-alanine N-acetyltransferase